MFSKKIHNVARTVAFRLSVWYAAVFTGSMLVSFIIFYFALMRGIHHVYLSPRSLHELLEAYLSFFSYALGIAAVSSVFVGWFLAKRALVGVGAVTRTAVSIAGADLDRKVPVKGTGDEIDQLAIAFNDMLERIRRVLVSMKQTSDNIAHDLRTPVAGMRGAAEMALSSGDSRDERLMLAGTVIEECDRLLGMINAMLDISQAEVGLSKADCQEMDLAALLRDMLELFQPVVEDRNIRILMDMPESLTISADRTRLQRVFANLLDNALKYTPSGGLVKVSLRDGGPSVDVVVEDNGSGIAESDLPRIFERFFRGERSRSMPGNGLGLSLANAFVQMHGGTIIASSSVGKGSQFTVRLPRQQISPLPVLRDKMEFGH